MAAGAAQSNKSDGHANAGALPEPRTRFPAFPYDPPYPIQQEFMAAVYRRLQSGGIGLFESPTGTGKTLSLICSVLQWLEDKREAEVAASTVVAAGTAQSSQISSDAAKDDEPAWMREHVAVRNAADAVAADAARKARIAAARARTQAAQQRRAERKEQAAARAEDAADAGRDEDADFALEEWDSDSGRPVGAKRGPAALRRLPGGADSSDSEDSSGAAGSAAEVEGVEATRPPRPQVIFASRTHSQLSQFVGELRRTPFALSVASVALASRKVLCINEEVARLRSGARISEKCLDLQQQRAKRQAGTEEAAPHSGSKAKARKGGGGCPFLAAPQKAGAAFRAGLLAAPRDVEELVSSGRRKAVCPYYAARGAAAEADLLLVPYGALLTQETREALGIRLEGAVLVIDEAHNLVDAVNGAHSAMLSAEAGSAAAGQLDAYWTRFSSRLAPGNARHLQALLAAATKLSAFLQPSTTAMGSSGGTAAAAAAAMTVNDFLFAAGLDHVNMFSLVRYVKESKVLFKVAGFADAQRRREAIAAGGAAEEADKMGALHALVGFLGALTNADADGRIILDPPAGAAKFVLLNAAAHFHKVTAQAHALILASGTLAPVSALTAQLFPDTESAGIGRFECGHVVPRERLLALALGTGPTGRALDLRHAARGQPALLDELARLLLNVCQAVPQGVVVFFPSFAYAEQVAARWRATGDWARVSARKRLFQEPRAAGDVEAVLSAYSACIGSSGSGRCGTGSGSGTAGAVADGSGSTPGSTATGGGGAVLLAVVGGKMAEGINFGDGLGRCVVMVGMPYPNPADVELRERMAFMDAAAAAAADEGSGVAQPHTSNGSGGRSPGQQYYQDLCMKAVNQCIGRCIRHAGDYAAIVLADARYAPGGRADTGPCRQLPGWVQSSLSAAKHYGDVHSQLVRFFRRMNAPAAPHIRQ